jgi:release factor H-coupled RctB family protein
MTWVTQVWVSKGEPYSGPPGRPAQFGGSGEVRIIAEKSFVDDQAIKQLEQVATLPGVHIAVGMPDLHPGNRYVQCARFYLRFSLLLFRYRFPIGCVIAADGIYPAMIGSDVGCGIALYPLLPPSKTSPNPTKLASRLKGLDAPWSGSIAAWLLNYGITRHSPFDEGSLGTVGGGNHFCEVKTHC